MYIISQYRTPMSTTVERTVSTSTIPEAFGYPIGLVFTAISADGIRFDVSINFRVMDIELCLDMRTEVVRSYTNAFSSRSMADILTDIETANYQYLPIEAAGTSITDFEIIIGDPASALKHKTKGWKRYIPFL